MPASYLHGVEILEVQRGGRPIRVVKTAVIGLVGTAPMHAVAEVDRTLNVPVLVSSDKDGVRLFGEDRSGYSIPGALDAILDQGAGQVIVVNVFDPAGHRSEAKDVAHDFDAGGEVDLGHEGIEALVVQSEPAQQTYVLEEDYGYDAESGVISRLEGGGIPEQAEVELGYLAAFSEEGIIEATPAAAELVVQDEQGQVTYVLGEDYSYDAESGVITRLEGGSIPEQATVHLAYRASFDAEDHLQAAAGAVDLAVRSLSPEVYILGEDYELDAIEGVITRLEPGGIPEQATVFCSFSYADPGKVAAADVIGSVDGQGRRSGLKALRDAAALFGFKPKILICPGWSEQAAVAAEMLVQAGPLRAMALLDAPVGQTVAQAIAARGVAGGVFGSSSKRAVLLYPRTKAYDALLGADAVEPYSPRFAGVMAAADLELGYWWSPSNKEIKGITGMERPITADISDPTCEANQLNEAGIVTLFSAFGTGIRTWGNRSASWPSSTHPTGFISVQRVADVVDESIEQAMLQFIDFPLDDGLIDAVVESVNGFIRTLIGRGALIDGRCSYNPARNPVEELAAGHVLFQYELMPPTPAERFTFEKFVNIELLRGLGGEG